MTRGVQVYAYVTPALLHAYLANPVLTAMRKARQLHLVTWDAVPECLHKPACQKQLAFAHIVLGLWGTGHSVLVGDVDEYLALPEQQDAAAFLRTCMGSAALARLPRFNLICDDCEGEELDMWRGSQGLAPLRHYTTCTGYEPRTTDKLVVDTERVHGFSIHDGHVLAGGARVEVNKTCARIVHLINVFRNRVKHANWDTEFRDWHWVL